MGEERGDSLTFVSVGLWSASPNSFYWLTKLALPGRAVLISLLASVIPSAPIVCLLQCVILGYATWACFSMRVPWMILVGLGLSGVASVCGGITLAARRSQWISWSLVLLRISTLIVVVSALLGGKLFFLWTSDNALVLWLVAMMIWLTTWDLAEGAIRRRWRAWFVFWALLGALVWLAAAYMANQRPAFCGGLLVWLTLLVFCRKWFRMPSWGIQAVNTLMLLIIGLPIVSLLCSPADQFDLAPKLAEKPYSYEVARKDPAKYARWCRYNRAEGEKFFAAVNFDTKGTRRLRPNAVATFFESRISINSQGFRGAEIPSAKGDAYRIVTLGESTTFGLTLEKDDRPWPEILERLIQERLKPSRPVQVINAGIPGCDLEENLARLPQEILCLQPDMIISYHGINGFSFIYEGMPPVHGKPPPPYQQRPLKILADLEYQLAVRDYRKHYELKSNPRPGYASSPMETKYAQLYRQLVDFAQTNRIRLVLATYSMAVNEQSPQDMVDFYRLANLGVEWQIRANLAHSLIVRQLVRENPGLCLVDTCPVLDGQHDLYYDLVHFTPEGEMQMAEVFFTGVRKTLEADLMQKTD